MNSIFALWLFANGMGNAHLQDFPTNAECEKRGASILTEFSKTNVGAFYFCLQADRPLTDIEVMRGEDGRRWLRINGDIYRAMPKPVVVVPAKKASGK